MDINAPTPLLGGLSPRQFMSRHWHKRPLLVRQALPGIRPPVSRQELFALAASEDVESRLVRRVGPGLSDWTLRHGPLGRRQIPPIGQPGWTLLVQGLDAHVDEAHALLQSFRFVPDARLDDLMVSYASDGGGVGPHLDAYDVFLIQVQGRRRWRVAPPGDADWVPDVPLKLLAHFEPTQTWILEPGDLLYLPPGWGHDGDAVGPDCMTCSVGFRSPSGLEVARALLPRMADLLDEDDGGLALDRPGRGLARRYADPRQAAVGQPARLPAPLRSFAQLALHRVLMHEDVWRRALGEWLTEPKPTVWFPPGEPIPAQDRSGVIGRRGLRLDRRTRMLLDGAWLFVNGEAFRIGGRDARWLGHLADARCLAPADCRRLSEPARQVIGDWLAAGWLRLDDFCHP